VRRFKGVIVYSPNGEIHCLLEEFQIIERTKIYSDFDEDEIKKLLKREASKPLYLSRD
jgi:hypothetical protein